MKTIIRIVEEAISVRERKIEDEKWFMKISTPEKFEEKKMRYLTIKSDLTGEIEELAEYLGELHVKRLKLE